MRCAVQTYRNQHVSDSPLLESLWIWNLQDNGLKHFHLEGPLKMSAAGIPNLYKSYHSQLKVEFHLHTASHSSIKAKKQKKKHSVLKIRREKDQHPGLSKEGC